MKKIQTIFTLAVASSITPFLVSAQGGSQGPGSGGSQGPGGGGSQTPGGTTGGNSALQNPLAVDSVSGLLVQILEVLIVIAVPIIVIFIIISGFKFVTAQGNQQKLTEAKQALLYAIIGGVLIIGALAIAEIVKNLVDAFQ